MRARTAYGDITIRRSTGDPEREEAGMTTTATSTRPAVKIVGTPQVVRRQGRARRRRPRGRRGHGLRAARPERRRQDDDRADPVHADSRRLRSRCGSPVTTSLPTRTGCAPSIGVTGQFSAVDELLTGEENLRLMADLHHLGRAAGRRRVTELLERFDLVDAARKPVSTYSGGMRRRLDLAMTLVGSPQVIFLDEPTTGLDPRSRRTMWEIIRELVAERRHDLPDHAVPRRGRPARGPDRRPRPGSDRRRGHPRRAQAPHSRRPCSTAVRRPRPALRRGRCASSTSLHATRSARPPGAQRRQRRLASSPARRNSTTPASTSSSCRSTPPTWTTCSSR